MVLATFRCLRKLSLPGGQFFVFGLRRLDIRFGAQRLMVTLNSYRMPNNRADCMVKARRTGCGMF